MRIQNNLMALNAYRYYNLNLMNLARSMERLSSGYRINRAGDDPAGLAISEKMRAQIRGLNMAVKNCYDGISMIQTAEGALQESQNILQRMRELAVQAASDSNEKIDRVALQQEFAMLIEELDDIAGKTRFNDQNLLDGTFQKAKSAVSLAGSTIDTAKVSVSLSGIKPDRYTIGIEIIPAVPPSTIPGSGVGADLAAPLSGGDITNVSLSTSDGAATDVHNGNTYTLKVTGNQLNNMTFQLVDTNGEIVSTAHNIDVTKWNNALAAPKQAQIFFDGVGTFKLEIAPGAEFNDVSQLGVIDGAKFKMGEGANAGKSPIMSDGSPQMVAITLGGETVTVKKGDAVAHFSGTGVTLRFSKGSLKDADLVDADAFFAATGLRAGDHDTLSITNVPGKPFVIQSGPNEGDTLSININAADSASLGVRYSSLLTRESASRAITEVNSALNRVSTQRAGLGAMQNRLEFKISYLESAAENLTAAESRIRDLDYAKEIMAYTKHMILMQVATAMLAQANAIPQMVLQLLMNNK